MDRIGEGIVRSGVEEGCLKTRRPRKEDVGKREEKGRIGLGDR